MLSDNPNNAIYLGPAGSEVFRFSRQQSEKLEKLVTSEQNLVALAHRALQWLRSRLMETMLVSVSSEICLF